MGADPLAPSVGVGGSALHRYAWGVRFTVQARVNYHNCIGGIPNTQEFVTSGAGTGATAGVTRTARAPRNSLSRCRTH